jgi:uncharacterized protein (TIGR02231 family)
MKNKVLHTYTVLIFTLIFALSAFAHSAFAESAPLFKISNIIVYSDGAMIKKESAVTIKKGENVIAVTGLTSDLIDQSVQVSAKSKNNVKITDVKIESTYLNKAQQEKAQKLQARLDNLNELIKKNSDEITALNSSIDFIKRLAPFHPNQKPTLAELAAYMKFIEKSISENLEKAAKIEKEQKKLREEAKAVENELKNIGLSRENTKNIVLYLFAEGDSKEATLAVSYIITKAGWHPQYDVRADSSASKIDISYFAVISQSTGEDWKDVNIEISTAKPFVYGALPELTAWNVDVYQHKPVMYKFLMMPKAAAKESVEMEMASAMPEEIQVKTETTSFSFIMPWKLDIPSDNNPHKFLISSASKESKFEYYVAPKLSKYAHLKASAPNPFAFPMLIGEMNVFLDGKFVNTTTINKSIVSGENISLSLGVDEGIKVEKKLQKKFTEHPGVFSKNTKIKYEYSIDITNGKGKGIDMTLSDNFPVSLNEQIKIELESPKKEEVKISDDRIITWDIKLNPGEKRNLSVKFSVEYPQNLNITGLE